MEKEQYYVDVPPHTLFIPGAYYTSAQIRNKLDRTDILVLSFYAEDDHNAIGLDSWKEVITPADMEEVVWEAVSHNMGMACFPFTTRWGFNGDNYTFERVYAAENNPKNQFTVYLKPYEPYT